MDGNWRAAWVDEKASNRGLLRRPREFSTLRCRSPDGNASFWRQEDFR